MMYCGTLCRAIDMHRKYGAVRVLQMVWKEGPQRGGGDGGKWWHNIITDSDQTSLQVNDRLQYSDTEDVRATTG